MSKISWIPISDLSVGVLQGVEVSLAGLGPLNWVGRKVNYVTVMLGLLEINLNLNWVSLILLLSTPSLRRRPSK